ncbi:DNA recombination protein RmuC [Gracilinema caldarium]|uniref:DNA recombination protein RmuC n=1 Tax=Gracilinema caldarium TaxID=215591 RepID=UPI0026EACBB3|nr:DNA recombination protein RmuC [Gracilinema caldarium]
MELILPGILFIILFFLILFVFLIVRSPNRQANNQLLAITQVQERLERSLQEELRGTRAELTQNLARIMDIQANQLAALRTEIARFGQGNDQKMELLRETVDRKLRELQMDNAARLEQIRKTVDDKLHETLEKRLGESFKLVGDRLEQVQAGLGEMRSLAAGVGDLKRVLVNVKNRGTWGEVQLISIIQDLLAPHQYELNAAVQPGSAERVEVVIRLPGASGAAGAAKPDGIGKKERPVLLPIDAKFPKEDYERLVYARENGDTLSAEAAGKLLEQRLKLSAKDIYEKYIHPPYTTDFAILFLPSEGLFAEILSRPGLAERIQRELRVVIAGPTTLAAMINSLQMGFRTLAVEQRTTEVWRTLNLVKADFEKFGELLDKTRKKLQEAADTVDLADKKSRTIQGKLQKAEQLQEQISEQDKSMEELPGIMRE